LIVGKYGIARVLMTRKTGHLSRNIELFGFGVPLPIGNAAKKQDGAEDA